MPNHNEESSGPLFRVRLLLITSVLNRATRQWEDTAIAPGPQYTVLQTPDAIDLQTSQPVFDLASIPIGTLRALLNKRKPRGSK